MGQMMKVFFILCFAAFSLLGCGQGKGPMPEVTGPQKTKSKTSENPAIDMSKLTPEQVLAYELMAKDVRLLMGTMRDADRVFHEIWPHIIAQNSPVPNNVFRVVWSSLSQIFNDSGLPFAERTKMDCQRGIPRWIPRQAGKEKDFSYDLVYSECKASEKARKANSKSNSNSKPKPKPKPNAVKAPQNNETELSSFPIAHFMKSKDGSWMIQFVPSNLGDWPNALGLLSTQVSRVSCQVQANEYNKLQYLDCMNIGQNVGRDSYILMSSFIFDIKAELQVKIKGEWHEPTALPPKPKVHELLVTDHPISNKLKVDLTAVPNEDTPQQPPQPQAQAPASTPAPAGPVKTQEDNKDPKKISEQTQLSEEAPSLEAGEEEFDQQDSGFSEEELTEEELRAQT